MTIAELVAVLPEKLLKITATSDTDDEGALDYVLEHYPNQEFIQTEGDIEEMYSLLELYNETDSDVTDSATMLFRMYKSMCHINAKYSGDGQMGWQEFYLKVEQGKISRDMRFLKDRYPAMYKTGQVWAWG